MKLHTVFFVLLLMIPSMLFPQINKNIFEGKYKNILARSDAAFFPRISKFKFTIKLYENNKYLRYYELTCYLKGDRQYLAILTNPPVVRRQAQLRRGDIIWFYLGRINRTYETSAKASFEASTFTEEDLLSSSLGYFYKLGKIEEVELNGQKALELFLKSRSKKTAYYRIESFINRKTLLPIKRIYYSFSNQKIKVEKIIKIIKKNNKLQYLHLIMYDSLIKGRYSDIVMKNFEYPDNLDDRIFTKRYMEIATQ